MNKVAPMLPRPLLPLVLRLLALLAPALTALAAGIAPTAAAAQGAYATPYAYADPAGSGPILGAVRWVQGVLLGTPATIAAVIAVAGCGFMMLTGRMNWRHGLTVILGCFILFGAASIVAGIQAAAHAGG